MITLNVPDMHCGGCKASVEAALRRLDPGLAVSVDLPARTVAVSGAASARPEALVAALDAAGFAATVA